MSELLLLWAIPEPLEVDAILLVGMDPESILEGMTVVGFKANAWQDLFSMRAACPTIVAMLGRLGIAGRKTRPNC